MNIGDSIYKEFNQVYEFINTAIKILEHKVQKLFRSIDPFQTNILQKPIDKSIQIPLNDHFDKIFVINLRSATKKKELLSDHLDSIGVSKWERFDAVNGYALPDDYLPIEGSSVTFKDLYSRMPGSSIKNKKARAGCYLSHLNSIKKARAEGLNSVLILEDDALFARNKKAAKIFEETMKELPQNCDMLFLGIEHYKKPTPISKNIVRVEAGFCLHAYVVYSKCFDSIINDLESRITNPNSPMHPIDAITSEFFERHQYEVYAPRKIIAFQSDNVVSNITGKTNEPYSFRQKINQLALTHVIAPVLDFIGIKLYDVYNNIKFN